MNRIKVLIVDDSAVVRKMLSEAVAKERDIEVVGAAPDPFVARDMILSHKPDVLTLDIEMPRMDGLTFLTKLMHYKPMPVIVISSVAQSTCDVAVEAMRRGAVEVLAKPSGPFSVGEIGQHLAAKIRAAYGARVRKPGDLAPPGQSPVSGAMAGSARAGAGATGALSTPYAFPASSMIVIGASTGGTQAIEQVITQFPAQCPPILIAQHIPAGFSTSFAARLNTLCKFEVKEAVDGDIAAPGRALIAPGNFHMIYKRSEGVSRVIVRDGPRVHYQRPAVDVLFRSVAEAKLSHVVGILLTGMGADGAEGLLKLKEAGASTIAQDEATCVVFGMPKVAIEMGAAQQVVPLHKIASAALGALAPGRKESLAS